MRSSIFLVLMSAYSCTNGGFILFPSELVPVAELIYSRLPPITAGVDSKVGFGFRIGRNADAQILFELGPQKYTTYSNEKVSDKAKRSEKNRFRSFPAFGKLNSFDTQSKASHWVVPFNRIESRDNEIK